MNNIGKTKLTSVKILEDLYIRFKSKVVNTNMTLQKLTNRSIERYLTDEDYRDSLDTSSALISSGSNF
jgi:predicted house-cleaning NTP pyrophosphatase (Maf/HAM1 superfamily)